MQQRNLYIFLLLLFVAKYQTQVTTTQIVPDWNGDPKLCTTIPAPTPAPGIPPPMPKFPNVAEFAIEQVQVNQVATLNFSLPSELSLREYLYDYNANFLIMVKNQNGDIDAEYFYYNKLLKSTYLRLGQLCIVSPISTNQEMDGASAIEIAPNQWHIRPLNEFLLFSSNDRNRPMVPVYLGTDIVRGIPVYKWQTCYINKTDYRTVRRIWAIAQETVTLPGTTNDNYSVPIQATTSASYDYPNGTQRVEVDEVFNVYAFRPGIMESNSAISPPRGAFCASGAGQDLVSLKDIGIEWPNHFNVHIDARISRTAQVERFHMRYDQGREGGARRLRYDYLPVGSEDYESVIHDYTDNLTYVIDRRVGKCKITTGVEIPDINPIRDPIRFFIKHEAHFIFNPPEKAWEFNGIRKCRGNTIICSAAIANFNNFPVVVDPDTGVPTGESWAATTVDYSWSTRIPFGRPKQFDYPISLFLRMYRFEDPSTPSIVGIRTEDIEYEFYQMSHERYPNDFDTSLCYRSLNYEYIHVVLTLNLNRGTIADSNLLNRRRLIVETHFRLMNTMQIKYARISDVEIEHETVSNDVQVFFTILGPTPKPESQPPYDTNEPSASTSYDNLKKLIDGQNFAFDFTLSDNSSVQFKAKANSLKFSQQYMSTHLAGPVGTKTKYSTGSLAAAIIVGLLIGIIVGVIIAAAIRILRKDAMPSLPTSISNQIPQISFSTNMSGAGASTA